MADVKISQLPASTTPLDGTEVLPIVQSATTKQVSVANLTAGRAVSALSLSLTNALPVTSGGTGLATTAAGTLLSSTALNTISATATPTLGVAGTTAGTLGLSGSSSGVVTLATASGAAGTWTMRLPTTGGTNGYILTTDGSGVTTWTNPTALGIDLDVGTTAITNGTANYVLYQNSSNVLAESSNLQFDGSKLGIGGAPVGILDVLSGGTSSGVFFKNTDGDRIQFTTPNRGTTYSIFGLAAGMPSIAAIGSGISLDMAIGSYGAGYLAFGTDNTERMRIMPTTGYVGINQTSPQFIFTVKLGAAGAAPSIRQAATGYFQGYGGSSSYYSGVGFAMNEHTNGYWGSGILAIDDTGSYGGALGFYTSTGSASASPTEKMRLDSAGNLGLGVTPSAWSGSFKALEFSYASLSSSDSMSLSNNAYRGASGWVYKNTAPANLYQQNSSGNHIWSYAASGSAGSTISFTQAMTLDANAYLNLNTSGNTNGRLVSYDTAKPQFLAYGYSRVGGATANNGALQLGNNSQFAGILDYDASSNTTFYIDNTYDSAAAATKFRMRTYGTAVEAVTITGAGNVGIGTSSPANRLDAYDASAKAAGLFHGYSVIGANANTNNGCIQVGANGSGCFRLDYDAVSGGTGTASLYNTYGGPLVFGVSNTEKARIDSNGNFLVRTTSILTPGGVAGVTNLLNPNNDGSWALAIQNNGTSASNGRCLGIRNATDYNTTSSEFIYCVGNTTPRFYVQSNGGVYNYSANNSNLSDARVKKDVQPAGQWLNKIVGMEIVKFKYKDQTHDDFNIGVIAQQVEKIAPELVNPEGFGDTPEDGVPLKSIYETDLMYAAIRALQELAAKVAVLEAK